MNEKLNRLREDALKKIEIQGLNPSLFEKDIKSLIEELSIYQVELEQQNIELISSQAELELIKDRYHDLFHLAPTGYILLDSNLRIKEANYTIAGMLGTIPAKLAGTSFTKHIAPDFQDTFFFFHKELFANDRSLQTELALKLNEKERIYTNIHGIKKHLSSGDFEYRLGIIDITDKKIIEEKLKVESSLLAKSEQKFRQIVENSHDIFFYFDLHTNYFKYISPKLFDILGYSTSEMISLDPEEYLKLIHPDYQSGFKNVVKEVLFAHNEGSAAVEKDFKIVSKSGDYKWLSGSFCITNDNEGKPNQLLGSLHDITRLKEYEDELTYAKEKAQESDRLKSVFLANLSHEIRTPMNGILGFAGLMKTEDLEREEYLTYVDVIEKSGKRLLNLINELINISKIEAGQFTVTKTRIIIYELLDELYQFFSLEARTKGIELRVSTLGITKQTTFETDKDKIYEVLINLIKNALKYTDSGHVEIGVEKHPNSYYFYVSDTGRGIPEDKQFFIFERFRQAEETNFREGTGLGLSISKGFVELMGGTISFSSEVGVGSKFWFDLPNL